MRLLLDEVSRTWEAVLGVAHAAGRDPADLRLVVRGHVQLTDRPLGGTD